LGREDREVMSFVRKPEGGGRREEICGRKKKKIK